MICILFPLFQRLRFSQVLMWMLSRMVLLLVSTAIKRTCIFKFSRGIRHHIFNHLMYCNVVLVTSIMLWAMKRAKITKRCYHHILDLPFTSIADWIDSESRWKLQFHRWENSMDNWERSFEKYSKKRNKQSDRCLNWKLYNN